MCSNPGLGRMGDPEALPVLLEVLEDRTVDMDTIIAVVRALGRIGDDWVVPILLKLLERDDRRLIWWGILFSSPWGTSLSIPWGIPFSIPWPIPLSIETGQNI